jgi:hypothetical protein
VRQLHTKVRLRPRARPEAIGRALPRWRPTGTSPTADGLVSLGDVAVEPERDPDDHAHDGAGLFVLFVVPLSPAQVGGSSSARPARGAMAFPRSERISPPEPLDLCELTRTIRASASALLRS